MLSAGEVSCVANVMIDHDHGEDMTDDVFTRFSRQRANMDIQRPNKTLRAFETLSSLDSWIQILGEYSGIYKVNNNLRVFSNTS